MASAEIIAKVKVLADNALRSMDKLQQENVKINHASNFVIYLGFDEVNAIRYVASAIYWQRNSAGEFFVGCRMVAVKEQSYFHVAVKGA